MREGASEGFDPSPNFDSSYYLEQNPGVAASGMNPLDHYIRYGQNEGRSPTPSAFSGKVVREAISLGLDVAPFVGDAKGVLEAVIGRNLITGEKLGIAERAISLATSVPGLGEFIFITKIPGVQKLGADGYRIIKGKLTQIEKLFNNVVELRKTIDDYSIWSTPDGFNSIIPKEMYDAASEPGIIDDIFEPGSGIYGAFEDAPLLTNKFPGDVPIDGKIFGEAKISDGRVSFKYGREIVRDNDFVITSNKQLILGRRHATLSNQEDVFAAGQIKLDGQGRIRRISNKSGHYRPTVEEASRYPEMLRDMGLNTQGATLQLYEFQANSSGYVINQHGKAVVNRVLLE